MKKNTKIFLGLFVLIVFAFTLFNLSLPFAIFGEEFAWKSGSFYAGSVGNNWFWITGKGVSGLSDDVSNSFLANDNFMLNASYRKAGYWTNMISSSDLGAICHNNQGSMTQCVGDVAYWRYNVLIDGKQNGYFGDLSFAPNNSALESNYDTLFNMTTLGYALVGSRGENHPCNSIQDTYLKNLCNSKQINMGYYGHPSHFSRVTFTKNLNIIDYDKNKYSHDVQVILEPRVLQYLKGQYGYCVLNNDYFNFNDPSSVLSLKQQTLQHFGVPDDSKYYNAITYSGRSGCISSECGYYQDGRGCQTIINFNISNFPELLQKFSNKNKIVYNSKIYIEPEACSDQSNFVTKMFTASAGDVVSLNPEIGQVGVPSEAIFCHTLPVLKQTSGTVFEQDYEPYEALKSGSSVTIPAGQNWIFFYKAAPTSGGYYFCADKNGVYDTVTNKCVIAPAIEYTCVSGVFDPVKKTCLTQATVQKICSSGVYNTQTDVCEYFPPMDIICNIGDYNVDSGKCSYYPDNYSICNLGVFNSSTNKCDVFPNIQNVCSKGTFDASKGFCVYTPVSQLVCSAGFLEGDKCIIQPDVVNGLTSAGWQVLVLIGVVSGLVVLGGFYFFFVKKKRR